MTRILRLLLIAAIALPLWQPIAAQVTPPSDGEPWQIQTDYYIRTANTSSTETGWALGSFGTNRVNVVVSGTSIYVQGFSKTLPEAWVVGTISGTTVTFATGQLFGQKDGVNYYFVGEYTPSSDVSQTSPVYFDYNSSIGMLTQRSYDATETLDDGTTRTYKAFYYINEVKEDPNDLTKAVAYFEGVVMMEVKDYAMKTLTEDEVLALANTPDGDKLHYTYTYNNQTYTGSLLDKVVVERDDELAATHAIALMRAVYTNPYLPGPKYRGFDVNGNVETGYPVSYEAVGTLSGYYSSTNGWSSLALNDTYGWGIPAGTNDIKVASNGSGRTVYCNPEQYQPNEEGYTLMLVEMQDEYTDNDVWNSSNSSWRFNQNDLLSHVKKTIKSVQLLTEAKRTGTNVSRGTLFKIDAEHLNRFFFLGKGQMRIYPSSYTYTTSDGTTAYIGPYLRRSNNNSGNGSYTESDGLSNRAFRPFAHMFEQFSPAMGTDGVPKSDIYNLLVHALDDMNVTKTGFPVLHDCSSVPYAETDLGKGGHEFKMLDDTQQSSEAPTVRDLLFFVPDFRMMYHTNTVVTSTGTYGRDYANRRFAYYNQNYAPRMDMYIIHLLPINGKPVTDPGVEHVYELEVNWKSNMASFLPATEQVFTLYRCITDANGPSEFEPVYKTNHNGDWVTDDNKVIEVITETDEFGTVTTTYKVDGAVASSDPRVPIVMQGMFSLNELDYFDYIKMDLTGKQVTYYVVGQDAAERDPETGQLILDAEGKEKHFLGAQQSNSESYMIPGYKKNLRLTFNINTENYSKFDFKNQKNDYWNEILVSNNKGTCVTANFFQAGDNPTKIYFRRIENQSFGSLDNPNEGDIVATATVRSKGDGKIIVDMLYEGEGYTGQETFDGSRNSTTYNKTEYTFTYPTTENGQTLNEDQAEVDFGDWKFYDNFTADVKANEHPNLYAYRAYFKAAAEFPLYDVDQNGDPILEEGYETVEEMVADPDMKSDDVFSEPRLFKVYKTTPSINSPLTLSSVLNDNHMTLVVPTEAKLTITAERSSKSELLRYEICRWAEGENTEPAQFTANGTIQNQANAGYSVSFGGKNFNVQSQGAITNVVMEDEELEENGGSYYYVPQAVVYSNRKKTDGTYDTNTYGAPRVHTAMGKVEIDVNNAEDKIGMSDYRWYALDANQEAKWFSYYNILMKFTTLNIPSGYELYKVRAWRKIDKSILGEESSDRQARITEIDGNGYYLYEDINYGDPIETPESDDSFLGMSTVHYFNSQDPSAHVAMIGDRSVSIAKPQDPNDGGFPEPLFENAEENEIRATFGAVRMKMSDNDNIGALPEMDAEFKVRAYFTRSTNPLIANDTHSQLYVMGDMGDGWHFDTPIATLSSNNGSTFSGTVVIPNNGYIILAKEKNKDWNAEGGKYLLGAKWDNGNADVDPTWVFQLRTKQNGSSQVLYIDAGTYTMTVDDYVKDPVAYDYYAGSLTITKNTRASYAPSLRMTGDAEEYFVAEGKVTKNFSKNEIVTGIVENLNSREIVGVTYYNVAGIESREPFDGVNIVVTRYSDGTTTTTKILK